MTDQQKTLTVRGSVDSLPLASSQIRESDSIVKARSGQIIVIGGLMDEHYIGQPMTWGKFLSILEHLWIPVIIVGTAGTVGRGWIVARAHRGRRSMPPILLCGRQSPN